MPWKEVSIMMSREEFVTLANVEGTKFAPLCERFGITPRTGYKWRKRYAEQGRQGLCDASRRPRTSPGRTSTDVEQAILKLRGEHPAWGARKLRARLQALGVVGVPAASTVQEILGRHGLINPAESSKHRAFQRFERQAPNELWQMDFKGHFALACGSRCHPLTLLDDHSRYALGLAACGNELGLTVKERLTSVFRQYGMPQRMLMDNGAPWSGSGGERHTVLSVWLLRLGIGVSHGRPYHPQTQGKEERFHRTLKAEVLQGEPFASLAACQQRFDAWRGIYNLERPHEALDMATPATRYQISPREYPESLPEIEYDLGDQVRTVSIDGEISYRNHSINISKAFRAQRVALRATTVDGLFAVWFGSHELGELNMRGDGGPAAVPSFVRYAHERRHGDSSAPGPIMKPNV